MWRLSRGPKIRLMAIVAVLALVVVGTSAGSAAPASAASTGSAPVPAQWIAKQFTEIAGHAPTPGEWRYWTGQYGRMGCGASTLEKLTRTLLLSREFSAAYPVGGRGTAPFAEAGRVVAAVRGVYSRDPSPSDLAEWYEPYASGTESWPQVVGALFRTSEFVDSIVPRACGPSPSYGFEYQRPTDILGGSRSEAQLQQQLDAARPGSTVYLRPGELIRVGGTQAAGNTNQALHVPAGVTLATLGDPGTASYARMGRIVADGSICEGSQCDDTGVVTLGPGARLAHVWVDGGGVAQSEAGVANVATTNSSGSVDADGVATSVIDDRFSDPAASGAAVHLAGWGTTGVACGSASNPVLVSGNLITGYGSAFAQGSMGQARWASGIVDGCEHARITGNAVVDVTDRGISITGERFRIPVPPAPGVSWAAGPSSLPAGTYQVTYSYHWSSPAWGSSGVSPLGQPCDGTSCSLPDTNGDQIDVATITGVPAGVSSVTFYLAGPSSTDTPRAVVTKPVVSGSVPGFAITAPGTGPAPPPYAQGSLPATQASQVADNTVLNAGNSAFAAYAADPVGECLPQFAASLADSVPGDCLDLPDYDTARDFAGARVDDNTYWTSSRAQLFAGLLIGDGPSLGPSAPFGQGVTFARNTVPVVPTRVNTAIMTSGMRAITLSGNTTAAAAFSLVDGNPGITDNKCPQTVWGYNPATASFSARSTQQPPSTANRWWDCMVPSPPAAMDRIEVAKNGVTFQGTTSHDRFNPVGINYLADNGGLFGGSANLSTSLTAGRSYTRLATQPTIYPISAGTILHVTNGSSAQTFTVTADVPTASTEIPIQPATANAQYPAGGYLLPWSTFVHDFGVLTAQGYNTLRVFLEFADIVHPPSPGHPDGTPNPAALAAVRSVAQLAAQHSLYLDVTGLFESDGPTVSNTTITAGTTGPVTLALNGAPRLVSNVGTLAVGNPGSPDEEVVKVGKVTCTSTCTVTVTPVGKTFAHTHTAGDYSVRRTRFAPVWYDDLTATGSNGLPDARWAAQQVFWTALAGALASQSNVLDYDLVSEPIVVTTGTQTAWETGCIPVCYDQVPDLTNPDQLSGPTIIHAWLTRLIDAIRQGAGDTTTPITLGENPGAPYTRASTIGNWTGPHGEKIDFISPHVYPGPGAAGVASALDTVRTDQVGKPVVIEENFILENFNATQELNFLTQSALPANGDATGWYSQAVVTPQCSLLELSNPPGGNNCGDSEVYGIYLRQNMGQIIVTALNDLRQPTIGDVP